ncbi:hypothetical protein [Alkaliphilus metalliredigens]|nr:hypothetical protein [Alkaliphilus metalliredigens]
MMVKKVLKFLVIGIVALVIIGALLGDGEEGTEEIAKEPSVGSAAIEVEEETETEKEPEAEVQKASYLLDSGMYKIGTELPAGEYMLVADGMAYYETTKDSKGTFESILTNDNFFVNRYITVKDGEYLKLQSCKLYELNNVPTLEKQEMYKIGLDLEPGEYKVAAEGMGYIEVSTDSRGGLESIVTNDNFEGEKYITVQDGQYLKLMSAALE